MSQNQPVSTPDAPAAIGPYSQAISAGPFLFTSGQIPLDPKGGEIPTEFGDRVKRVLANLEAVLRAGGCTFDDVVKTTVFLTDLGRYAEFNELLRRGDGVEPPGAFARPGGRPAARDRHRGRDGRRPARGLIPRSGRAS